MANASWIRDDLRFAYVVLFCGFNKTNVKTLTKQFYEHEI